MKGIQQDRSSPNVGRYAGPEVIDLRSDEELSFDGDSSADEDPFFVSSDGDKSRSSVDEISSSDEDSRSPATDYFGPALIWPFLWGS